MALAGGGAALRDPNGTIVDSVGWGTATNNFIEGRVAVAPPSKRSIQRLPDGADNGDNSLDFTLSNAVTPNGPNR